MSINDKGNVMIPKPFFSIIVTTYNRAHLLPRAIHSVLNQKYKNFEIIIVNDGSQDNTSEVVSQFEDKRIRYFIEPFNKGVLGAKNRGFDLAIGEYIFFLDDDDELVSDALESIVNNISSISDTAIKFFYFDAIDAESRQFSGKGYRNHEEYVTYKDLLCLKLNGDYGLLLNRDAVGAARFDERLWGNEGLLWLQLHKHYIGYYIPKLVLIAHREHGQRICNMSCISNLKKLILVELEYVQNFGNDQEVFCPKLFARHLSALGFFQILDGQTHLGKQNIARSLKYCFSLKYLLFYLLTYFLNTNQIIYICKKFKKV